MVVLQLINTSIQPTRTDFDFLRFAASRYCRTPEVA